MDSQDLKVMFFCINVLLTLVSIYEWNVAMYVYFCLNIKFYIFLCEKQSYARRAAMAVWPVK